MEDKNATARFEAIKTAQKKDAWVNEFTKMGTSNDPTKRTTYGSGSITSMNAGILEQMYKNSWLVQKAINGYAEDATREGVDLDVGGDNKDQDLIADVNKRMEKLRAKRKFMEALGMGRLYGGALLVVGANDGQEIEEPLNEDAIKSIDTLSILDRWQLSIKRTYQDPMKPNFAEPEIYTIQFRNMTGVSATHKDIHASRVIKFDGRIIPERLRIQNAGWHDSIMVAIYDDLKNYGIANQSTAVLFQDFITKVLKMPGLTEAIENDNEDLLNTRMRFALASMSNLGLALIEENEEFDKMQTPIQGLQKLFETFIEITCAAIGMPRTRVFGQQLGVLAGAEESTRNYYDQIKAYQELELIDKYERFYRLFLRDQSGINKGKEPEEWSITFNSLWQNTDEDIAKTHKDQADADAVYLDRGVVSAEEIAKSRFTKDGYSLETNIDFENREEMETIEEEGKRLELPEEV